nr:glycosyltransferase family 4 protein [Salsipaludibacter albus]
MVSPYDLDVPGGVQSHVLQLARHLRAEGDDVTVIGPADRSRGRLKAVGGSIAIPFNASVAPVALDPRVVRRVRRTLHELQPDVVHVHEPVVPLVSLAAAVAPVAPTVATFHAWSDQARLYGLVGPVARRALRRLSARIAVSSAAAGFHAGALGIPEGSFRIIPNGVEVGRFRGAAPFPSMTTPNLLFVGRLEPRKGLADLVRAFVLCKTDHPDLRLYVVGDGAERDRCQAMLPTRLRSDVVFLGRVDNDELPRVYASATVYVSPARGGESFGIVLAEAMAAGAPVVATSLPGYRSVASDGVNARLVPPGDHRALATAVAGLLDAPATAAALAEQASRDVERFDWGRVAADVRAVHRDVLRP